MSYHNDDEVDAFLKSRTISDIKYAHLPKGDKEKVTYQFFNDKSKRKLNTKQYVDPVTKKKKPPQTKVQYTVIDPKMTEEGEKLLDVPVFAAQQIEPNIAKGHMLLEITSLGLGTKTRYTVTAV